MLARWLSLAVWGVMGTGMVLLAEPIFRLFTDSGEVLAMAGTYMAVDVFYFLGMSLATGSYALLDGVAVTGIEMVIGIIESILVKVVCGMVFSQWFGVYGYWIGNYVGSWTTAVLVYLYFLSGLWKKRKVTLR